MVAVAWLTLAAFVLVALVLAVTGVFTLRRSATRLSAKSQALGELPLWRALDATSARIEATRRRFEETSVLRQRATGAVGTIVASVTALQLSLLAAVSPYVRAARDVTLIARAARRFTRQH